MFFTNLLRMVDASMKNTGVQRQIKSIIANECGVQAKSVTAKTEFMSGQGISYGACMGVLFELQHKFHVSLPESDFGKYNTVGGLTKNIIRQLKTKSK